MEFLKALHEAERYGVTRDAFMSIWQREAELNQKREDARILDLKQSLAMAEHQSTDPAVISQVEQMMYNLCQQVNLGLQQMSSFLAQEIGDMKKQVLEVDARLQLLSAQVKCLQDERLTHDTQCQDAIMVVLETRLNNFEKKLAALSGVSGITEANGVTGQYDHLLFSAFNEKAHLNKAADDGLVKSSFQNPWTNGVSGDESHLENTKRDDSASEYLKARAVPNGHSLPTPSTEQDGDLSEAAPHPAAPPANGAVHSSALPVNGTSQQAPATKPSISYSSVLKQTKKLGAAAGVVGPKPSDSSLSQRSDVALPDTPTEFKIGTTSGPLSMATFAAAMKGINAGGRHNYNNNNDSGKLSHRSLPENDADICIKNFSKFVSSGKVFESAWYYSHEHLCKVQVRMWFTKGRYLGVSMVLAPGEMDDDHRWPLVFSGYGKVYNHGSRTYTQLWEVRPEKCERVSAGKEHGLRTSIFLCSKREPLKDVTSDALQKKRYIERDTMWVKWSVEAGVGGGHRGINGYGNHENGEVDNASSGRDSVSNSVSSISSTSVDSAGSSCVATTASNSHNNSSSISTRHVEPPLGLW